jgi:predicted alpha/beta hydrolase family esterase
LTALLFLHGWQNHREEDHWQSRVGAVLRERGVHVSHPQLPDPDAPRLAEWMAVAAAELASLPGPDRAVACHSLSCLMWVHLAGALEPALRPQRVLLVAPPGPSFVAGEHAIAEFAVGEVDPAGVRATSTAAPLRLVCSDGDPYCVERADRAYGAPWGLDTEVLAGQAHLNPDSGYGDWPAMVDWCLDPDTRFARPAQ